MTDKELVHAVKAIVQHCREYGSDPSGLCPGCVFKENMETGDGKCLFYVSLDDWRMEIVENRG
jgi:hypothetical protein